MELPIFLSDRAQSPFEQPLKSSISSDGLVKLPGPFAFAGSRGGSLPMLIPRVRHQEKHFTGSAIVRDIVIGMSDGLTVPFALAAGLSGAVSSTSLVLIAGVAKVAAGSIAMGLGGFLAARGEIENYHSELARERREIVELPEVET
jgi:VIT family